MKKSTRKKHCYEYPRPAVTVDVIVATRQRPPRLLLIRRRHEPFAGRWAIPGGFVDPDEPLEAAARRELEEETGVRAARLEQLHTFGAPGRDPRGWTISVAYVARVSARQVKPAAADDAEEVGWFPLDQLPPLAFDHADILAHARRHLQKR
jgi:8-oxo-dGTP diphosphatase